MAVDLVAKIGADLTEFYKGIQNATKGLKGMAAKTKAIGKSMSVSLSAPILALSGLALKEAANLETLETSFVSLLGSAEKARATMQSLTDFAASTPFQLEGIGIAAKQLLAAGENTATLQPVLKTLGDIAAGANIPLSDMAAIFAKAKNKGKAMTEELMQLSDRGIPIISVLANKLNVSKEAIFKMASEGKISFGILKNALDDMSASGGIYADQMKVQSTTLGGIFSTLKDNISLSLGALGTEIVEAFDLKEVMTSVIESIKNLTAKFKALSPSVKKTIIIVAALVAGLGPALMALGALGAAVPVVIGGLVSMAAAASGFIISIAPIVATVAAVIAVIAGLATVAQFVADNWTAFKERFSIIWSHIKNGVISSVQLMISGLDSFLSWLGADFLNGAAESLDKFKSEIPNEDDLTPFGSFSDSFKNVANTIVGNVDKVKGAFSGMFAGADGEAPSVSGAPSGAPSTPGFEIPELKEIDFSFLDDFEEEMNEFGAITDNVMANVNLGFMNAQKNAALFGDEMSLLTEKQGVLKDAMLQMLEGGVKPTDEAFIALQNKYNNISSSIDKMNEKQKTQAVISGAAASAMNAAASSQEKGFKGVASAAGNAAKQVIQAETGKAIASFIASSFANLGIFGAALAAGAGAVVGGLFNQIPAFADGGIVSGPTLGLMGEYSGASSNPEVIAPLDKLKGLMGTTGQNVNVGGTFVLENDVLIAAVRQGESDEERVIG